ncbi:MAG: anti-sigma factor [Thermodesulfobacteriota bacterium]|jgi:Skp family chaperone for outer membrane proteins
MTHREIQELLPLYVLGGLDDESGAAVVRHLAESCEACAAELREWQEVVGLLPLGLIPDGPSPAVKARLMARVRQDLSPQGRSPRRWRSAWITLPLAAAAAFLLVIGGLRYQAVVRSLATQSEREASLAALLAQEQKRLAAREAEIEQLSAQLHEQRRVAAERAQTLARLEAALGEQRRLVTVREQELSRARAEKDESRALAATYARELAGLQAEVQRQRDAVAGKEREIEDLRAALARQRALVEASTREAARLREALTRQRGVIEVLTAPGLQVGYLRQAKRGIEAQGHVLWNERRKAWLFYTFGLPPPPPGKEYQVWFMTEREGPVSAGLFVPDQTGTGSLLTTPPSKLFGRITAAAVTLEPAGGLPKPSGEMYLRGSL